MKLLVNRTEPLSRAEYHSIMTAYLAIILSMIAIVMSGIDMCWTYVKERQEDVDISISDLDSYQFDTRTKTLWRKYKATISNRTQNPISITSIEVEIDGELQNYGTFDPNNELPLNLGPGDNSESIFIPVKVELDEDEAQFIQDLVNDDEDVLNYDLETFLILFYFYSTEWIDSGDEVSGIEQYIDLYQAANWLKNDFGRIVSLSVTVTSGKGSVFSFSPFDIRVRGKIQTGRVSPYYVWRGLKRKFPVPDNYE